MNSLSLQDRSLLCPACGYDLRGSASARCPECGLEIDRNALQTSAIPWAHRKSIGRARAYLRTVWQITIGSRKLAQESAKPQDPRDGAAFVRVTGFLIAVLLLTLVILLAWGTEAVRYPILEPISNFGYGPVQPPGWVLDVAIPWAAGVTLWPVPVGCLIVFAFHIAGVQRTVFRVPKGTDAAQRNVAIALACYTTGPLVLLIPSFALLIGGIYLMDSQFEKDFSLRWSVMVMMALGGCAVPAILALTLWRINRWFARVRHCGFFRASAAVFELLGLWFAGLVVLLGLFPWCAGFLWIVIDSFRR